MWQMTQHLMRVLRPSKLHPYNIRASFFRKKISPFPWTLNCDNQEFQGEAWESGAAGRSTPESALDHIQGHTGLSFKIPPKTLR